MNMSAEPSSSASPAPTSAKVYLPAITAAVVFVATLMVMIRGGVSADLTGTAPGQSHEAYQLIFARYIGVVDIVLGSLAPLAAMAAGAIGLGLVIRKKLLPQVSLLTTATAGLGLIWLTFEALGLSGMANALTAWGVCAIALICGLACHAGALKKALSKTDGQSQSIVISPYLQWHWSSVLVASPLAILLVAACCPPGTLWSVEAFGYDVLSYHLQIPREWLAAGRITGLEHNVYSYLPSLVETAFLQLGAMRGSMYKATYTTQLLNVALLLLTAAHLAKLVIALTPGHFAKAAGWFTAAIFLATPWVLVTGSMAYDEAAVLAFGAAALALSLDPTNHHSTQTDGKTAARPAFVSNQWAAAILAGVLVGLATQAKLTSGFMLAVPVGLIWLLRLTPGLASLSLHKTTHQTTHQKDAQDSEPSQAQPTANAWQKLAGHVGLLTLAGALILGPYLVRNAVWTGNPVFPFAAGTLGQGHWDNDLAARWQRGHRVEETISQRLTALGQQWLFNTGYGSVGGRARSVDPTKPEARNVAYFPKQWGFPTLLLAGFAGWLLLAVMHGRRRLAIALGVMVLVQIFAWLFLTHLQSRFMIFSLLPVCLAAGVGLSLAADKWLKTVQVVAHGASALLVIVLVVTSASLLRQQTIGQLPLWYLVDALPTQEQALDPRFDMAMVGDHPINKLPANSKTLLVADNSRLFYIQRPMRYHSAFDANPLGQLIREHPNNPQAVTQALKAMGITHVWLHGPELHRLMGSYGFDKDVTPESLARLIATGWRAVEYRGMPRKQNDQPLLQSVTLYQLP